MNSINLTGGVFTVTEWVILAIVAAIAAALLCALVYFVCVMIFKPDLKAEIRAMSRNLVADKARSEAENRLAEEEIKRSAAEIAEKSERAAEIEAETELMRAELMRQGVVEEQARQIAAMTLDELFVLKGKEKRDVSADFIINAITRRVLIDAEFERRADVTAFKVPANKEPADADGVESYIAGLPDAVCANKEGKKTGACKVLGKTFAMLSKKEDGSFKLAVKCGPYYGQCLAGLYPGFFGKADFPYGMIWFKIQSTNDKAQSTNKEVCSFELVKLLLYISYNIAKAGY